MRKVIFTILSVLLSVMATCQDIDFELREFGGGNHNPRIQRVSKLNEALKIYRKYWYEAEFQLIETKTFSSPYDFFEDESSSICCDKDEYNNCDQNAPDNIFYYITNNDSTSFSDVKGGNLGDSNPPEWPKLTHLDIENDNLVLYWEPSGSKDIWYYELHRRNSLEDWDLDPIYSYDKYESPITIAENICGNIDYIDFQYTIFAFDSCGTSSLVGDLELDSTLYLYPPILENVKYDNCNTLTFKWSKNRSLNGEITGCQIQYKLDETAQEIKDIDIPLSDIETIESDYQYSLKVSEPSELSNNNSLYFRIKTTARTTDGQYVSNNTCWVGPVTIGEIPVAPELYIDSVRTNSNNSENVIRIRINDKSSNPISGRKYILTREYDNNPPEIIWSKNDDDIPRSYNHPVHDQNISDINSSINYRLSAVSKCNNDTLGKAYFNSIYLDTIGNDTEITLSWNSISTNQYNDITYNVVRTYNGEEHSEDVQNNTTYTEDLSFIDPNSFKPVKWHVEAINNGNIIAVSNTITLENSGDLLMPDAFIPDSDIPINRFFGPMNKFDEKDIKKYRLLIFNNTGTLIWSTYKYSPDMEDNTSRWNGKDFNGQPCVRGTYIYEVYVELDKSDKPLTARGTVTLIRKN